MAQENDYVVDENLWNPEHDWILQFDKVLASRDKAKETDFTLVGRTR